jgi:hypothetical protein
VASGCGTIWGQRIKRDLLAGAATVGPRWTSQAARWRSVVTAHRAAWRSYPGSSCRDALHHLAGTEREAGKVGGTVERRCAVAPLQAPQTDAQKKDRARLTLIPSASFSSMRPGPRRIWPARMGAARGRLRASLPHGHWKTRTVVAGLRLSGIRRSSSSMVRSTGTPSNFCREVPRLCFGV